MAGRPGGPVTVRLLLDEHLSPEIAHQLRARGHDAIAVGERPVCLPHRFPLSRAGVGRITRALEAVLVTHPGDDALIRRGGELWLDDPPE